MHSMLHNLAGYGPSCSIRAMRLQLSRRLSAFDDANSTCFELYSPCWTTGFFLLVLLDYSRKEPFLKHLGGVSRRIRNHSPSINLLQTFRVCKKFCTIFPSAPLSGMLGSVLGTLFSRWKTENRFLNVSKDIYPTLYIQICFLKSFFFTYGINKAHSKCTGLIISTTFIQALVNDNINITEFTLISFNLWIVLCCISCPSSYWHSIIAFVVTVCLYSLNENVTDICLLILFCNVLAVNIYYRRFKTFLDVTILMGSFTFMVFYVYDESHVVCREEITVYLLFCVYAIHFSLTKGVLNVIMLGYCFCLGGMTFKYFETFFYTYSHVLSKNYNFYIF